MKKKAPRRVVKKKSGPIKITPEMVARARHKPQAEQVNWFAPAQHPKSVMPDNTSGMAQDDSLSQSIAWAQGSIVGAFMEGQAFLGYPYLSLLAQRPEYRRSSEVIANHMTRKWIKLQSSGDADKTERIKELNDELTRLKVRELFKEAAELDGFFGRSHLFIDLGDSKDSVELTTSIGTGAIDDKTSPTKVAKGKLKKIKSVEAVWCYPSNYNSDDPLSDSWYKPQNWYVQSREIHATRLLTFVGREVPDLLKPAYSFGGLSLSQMMKPYVDNWLQTRQSVSDLVQAFATMVLSTNLPDQINANNGEQLFQRIDFFNSMRKNRGTMAIDKDTEALTNVTTPLGSLDKLQAQSQEHLSSVNGIPLIFYLGITPSGLNATSEGEIEAFDDWINSNQESFFRPNLTTVINLAQLSLWGKVDPDIGFVFEPLRSMTDLERAKLEKDEADTDNTYIDAGVLAPDEVRKNLAANPDSRYNSIDLSKEVKLPPPPEQEDGKKIGKPP